MTTGPEWSSPVVVLRRERRWREREREKEEEGEWKGNKKKQRVVFFFLSSSLLLRSSVDIVHPIAVSRALYVRFRAIKRFETRRDDTSSPSRRKSSDPTCEKRPIPRESKRGVDGGGGSSIDEETFRSASALGTPPNSLFNRAVLVERRVQEASAREKAVDREGRETEREGHARWRTKSTLSRRRRRRLRSLSRLQKSKRRKKRRVFSRDYSLPFARCSRRSNAQEIERPRVGFAKRMRRTF